MRSKVPCLKNALAPSFAFERPEFPLQKPNLLAILQERRHTARQLDSIGPTLYLMTHTVREKRKLLGRVRRIRGLVDAIERAIENENNSDEIMHLIAGVRGAVAGLMAEVIEDHIRIHLLADGPEERPGAKATPRRS